MMLFVDDNVQLVCFVVKFLGMILMVGENVKLICFVLKL